MAKANVTTYGFTGPQEKAIKALQKSLGELNTAYATQDRLEDHTLALLILFFSKFPKVEPKSKEARALNKRAREIVADFCPNMPKNTVKLYFKLATFEGSAKKLNIAKGTTSSKTVLDAFDKAPDNKDEHGKKLTFAGFLRKGLPTRKAGTPKVHSVTPEGGITFTASENAKSIMLLLDDNIVDALTQNECKVPDDEIETFKLKICKAFDDHIVDIKVQA
jgi:ABC-type sugar transport system ATPase subunit|tara:strand:+ start:412 stop:1071 length:660 start_codon:yes stop_codon:yes gene_type:complete